MGTGAQGWSETRVRRSLAGLAALTLLALFVGFVWLPGEHGDFSAQGVWASICRAAGVPGRWAAAEAPAGAVQRSTSFVIDRAMAQPGSGDAVGRGATLALQCTMCHGAQGLSQADAPNLAGQYAEVVVKQLSDFKNGDRPSAIMQALAKNLSPRDMLDLAAYFSYLPKPGSAVASRDPVPALVRVGDPMRNIAPCASCHGGIDHKLGAPWLEGMPAEYLRAQLSAFARDDRHNDSHAQMRNMARSLSDAEVVSLAGYYGARSGAAKPP